MVLTKIDSDAIFTKPMKNRPAGEMIQAYQTLIDQLRTAGIVPKLHILDNKCSQDFKDTIHLNKITFQLVPPTITNATWRRRPSKLSRIIKWPSYAESTSHSL